MTNLELSKRLIVISEILNNAIEFLSSSYKMLMTDNSAKHLIVSGSPFLEMCRNVMWKMGVIELNKLFGLSNDKYRLSALLNYLITQHKNSDYKSMITLKELKDLKEELSNAEVSSSVTSLNELRDQHYAHSDVTPKHHISEIKLYDEHWIKLIQIASKIITTLDTKILESKVVIKTPNGQVANDYLNKRLEDLETAGKLKMTGR